MSWEQVALEDIAKVVGGSTPRRDNPAFWNGDIPWLTPTDLPPLGSAVTNITDTTSHITKEGFHATSLTLLPPSTVVFSSRATIGKVGVAEVPVTTNQGFVNLIPSDRVYSRYLAWALFHKADQIAALSGSTTFKEVSRTSVKRFRIPLPPLDKQRRIAHLLDEADRLQRLRKEANEKAQRILPALFVEMFGDPETNPMGWETRTLSEQATVKGGKRLPTGTPYADGVTQHPYVRAGDITAAGVRTSELKYITPETHACISRYVIRPNSVLITIAGKIGVAAAAPEPLYGANMTENAAIITLNDPKQMNPTYLAALLNTSWCQGQVDAATGRVTIGKLALFRIEALKVQVPPIALQDAFAGICARTDGIQASQRQAAAGQDAVTQTLRSRLFSEAV